jgi:hypothetical protein
MYFSAACLIGMRPLFAKFPNFLKTHFTAANGDNSGWRSTFGQRKADRLRLPSHGQKSDYASMQSGQEDAERGLRHLSVDENASNLEGGIPLAEYNVRDPYAEFESDRSEIRVETNIEVRHDKGNWLYKGNAGDHAHEYVYDVPVRAN